MFSEYDVQYAFVRRSPKILKSTCAVKDNSEFLRNFKNAFLKQEWGRESSF